ncbi:hypothetical protein VCHC46B1_1875 [Vibrio cholerae HC-46B1]|nr:hypothetical protein VCHC43B1_1952 [Vibrio cholerae HC-43B1]EKL13939.1 hypothetical protein VCHC60A1_1589 [Vibrio cholerae HC-60A1]EKL96934.1 hypothetical protein VCHC46B1_1875 [Vibrio cholerae HC-46B1]
MAFHKKESAIVTEMLRFHQESSRLKNSPKRSWGEFFYHLHTLLT